jgi:Rrf2 family iron-sulfur cluster assembly transcriptional regulator
LTNSVGFIKKPLKYEVINMKLTSKGRYAVMAMADLAKTSVGEPTSLAEISLRQGISLSFLEQIFLKLKKNNLVQSSRGPSGGYLLSKSPEEIKLLNIINAVDEKVKTVGCKKESKKGCTGKSIKCITHNLWDDLETHINNFFEKNTLRDIVTKSIKDRQKELN